MKTKAAYDAIFAQESSREYPEVEAFEAHHGHAIDRARLEAAARVLACPLKANPPSWQHGRVIYAALRSRLQAPEPICVALDIGTAKGFSAVMASYALDDAGHNAPVVSVDVIEPHDRVPRNSVAEAEGALWTVHEFVAPFVKSGRIDFRGGGSQGVLSELLADSTRVGFAFVDGKHNEAAVTWEIEVLASLQRPGDVVVFDDIQIPGVARAIAGAAGRYALRYLYADRSRGYAIGVRQ